MAIPLIKVYGNGNGGVVVELTPTASVVTSASNWLAKYITYGDLYPENNRVSLVYQGQGFTDKYPHQIADEDGNQIGTIEDVQSYFQSLGIGSGSTGGGITPDELTEILENYVLKSDYDLLEARVEVLEQSAGYVQLDTPEPVASNITASGATITWPAIPNATNYDVYLGNGVVANVTSPTYTYSGLTASQTYIAGVVAKGVGNYLPSDKGTVSFQTQGGQQPGNQNIFPLTFPFQFAS